MKNINRELMDPSNRADLSMRHQRLIEESYSFVGVKVSLKIHRSLYTPISNPVYRKMDLLLNSKLISSTLN